MDKVKPILKALLFGAIMLLFFICSALIAKALKLTQNRTYLFQAGFMLLSTIVPLFYIGSKKYGASDIGFNKINGKNLKSLLFYLPLVIALPLLLIGFNKSASIKSLLIQAVFYGSVAIATEIYFRGLIQKEFRGHLHIFISLIIIAIIYAVCNMYYFNRITYMKHIIIFSLASFAIACILGMIIESKGNIIFTFIFNTIYLLLSTNCIRSAKKLILNQGICLSVLFVYGLFLLITYMKKDKQEKIENKETFDEEGNIELN